MAKNEPPASSDQRRIVNSPPTQFVQSGRIEKVDHPVVRVGCVPPFKLPFCFTPQPSRLVIVQFGDSSNTSHRSCLCQEAKNCPVGQRCAREAKGTIIPLETTLPQVEDCVSDSACPFVQKARPFVRDKRPRYIT